MPRHEGLRVWHAANRFANDVATLCADLPSTAPAGLRGQLSEAAASVPDNIAEGAGRGTPGEKLKSYRYARGSLGEAQSQLQRCREQGLVDDATFQRLWNLSLTIDKMLARMIANLERRAR